MTFSICFWALLSQKDLSFVYLSSCLSKALGAEDDLLLGTSFFDYFHPEEQEMARHDLSELVKKKTLSCSVTRCQYNTIQTIRKKLQQSLVSSSKSSFKSQYSPASSTMTSPNFTTTSSQVTQRSDDEYMVMDVGMNVVSQDIVLACFHSDDVKQSNLNCVSSTCGEMEFTKEEVNKLTSLMRKHLTNKVQTPPSTPFPENFYNNETPNRIFQILDRKSRGLIFTWPDSNSNNYNKYDFSRLIWNSTNITRDSNIKKTNNLDVESPNCLRLLTIDKHMISTSGTYRQVESVIIPYGDIVFACFQMLPPATSTILGVSSAFTKPKARSAPCSPAATINSNNVYVKRPRSPGSLSPLPSFFYDDEFKRCNNPNSSCHHDVPEFILENNHRSKRHRIEASNNNSSNDQTLQHFAPIKISSSPQTPHLLLNPISPSYHDQQQRCSQPQFSFSQSTTSKDHQQPQTLHHPQPPYFSHVTPSTSQPRQPSPKRDYPSPTPKQDYPSTNQFHNITINSCNNNNNNNNNNSVTQPQQSPPPSSQTSSNQSQQRYTQFAPQQRRNNNTNNNNNNVQGVKKCESCHTSSSPEWRRGPTGHKTLCNACGLRYSRTIARENRKREQAQREQEQRQREQREREERARERAAATVMMQRVIEPFSQYRSPNATTMPTMPTIPVIAPGQQHQQVHHQTTNSPHSSGSLQYLPSTLPPITPISYHRHHQPQPSHHHHHHNIRPTPLNHHHHQHQHQIDLPPPSNNDRVGYTLPPPPHFFDRQQNGTGGPTNGSSYQIPGSR